MDQLDQQHEIHSPENVGSYWSSVLLAGGIFSLISFVIGLVFGYIQIGSEPSGSFFAPYVFSGVFVCLATAMAGLVAVWHYTKEVTPVLKLGKGALIGFLTGVAITLFSAILNEIWVGILDPSYMDNMISSIVENIEAMEMPEESKNQMIDQTVSSMQDITIFTQLMWGIPATGLLNLLTGMLGVKFFAAKNEEGS